MWAQKANPEAHAAQIYRDQQDIKMLQKKKKSRELSNNLWQNAMKTKKNKVRDSQASTGSSPQKSARSNKSVGFSSRA